MQDIIDCCIDVYNQPFIDTISANYLFMITMFNSYTYSMYSWNILMVQINGLLISYYDGIPFYYRTTTIFTHTTTGNSVSIENTNWLP